MTLARAQLPLADAAAAYQRGWQRGWTVRALQPIWQWADKHRFLPSETSKEPGRWRTERNPLARAPMESLSPHSGAQIVTICAGTQTIKSETGNNAVGYWITEDPATIVVVQPTKMLADGWKLTRFDPLCQLSPAVAEALMGESGAARRDSANTLSRIRFRGGWLIPAHAHSFSSLSMYSARYLFLDEIDSYEIDRHEGDPLETVYSRADTFGTRKKILQVSSPKKVMGASLIWREYLRGDQREAYLPCPKCDHYQTLELDQITETGEYLCQHCGHAIPHSAKTDMLAAHQWRAKHPERTLHHSYRASSLYSPIGLGLTWLELRKKYDEVADDPPALKAFVSTKLARPYEDKAAKLEPDALKQIAEDWPMRTIPAACLPLVAAVDLQANRFELKILGFGRGTAASPRDPQLYVIDYAVLPGSPIDPAAWQELDDYLSQPITNAYGVDQLPRAVAVDSGNWTREAYAACYERRSRHWIAVKGASSVDHGLLSPRRRHDLNHRGQWLKHGGFWHMVGTHTAKDTILTRLVAAAQQPPDQRWWHLPSDLPEAWYKQITSERRDPETGRWEQISSTRNEVPDIAAYAWAIAHLPRNYGGLAIGTRSERDWQRDREQLQPMQDDLFAPAATPGQQPQAAPTRTGPKLPTRIRL